MSNIKFSILIPICNINQYILKNIKHIKLLNNKKWELIILTDYNEKNSHIIKNNKIKIIPTGKISPGKKRDIGAKFAKGDILVFLDDDSFPRKNLLDLAEKEFNNPTILAVGGPGITPTNEKFWGRVSGSFFLSKYSGGNPDRYLSIGEKKEVYDWPSVNFMIRKKSFLEIKGFNNNFWPGEDTFFCLKLINSDNGIILYNPKMVVYHYRRPNLISHLKQISNYGLHRGYFSKKFPKTSRKIIYYLPSFFVILLFLSFIIIIYSKFFIIIISFYIIYSLIIIKALIDIKKFENYKVCFFSVFYIILSHIFYGVSFIKGLFTKKLKSKLR
jgi:cellulose synthase/poly-beta-1,6-N-acetylglucosamine synthase-like glycosyltransferase